MTERQLQDAVVECATLLGWRTYHVYDSRRSQPGFPDLVCVRGPRLLFVELKTAKGRLSPAQLQWLDDLTATAAEVFTWRPEQWANGAIEKALR